jgi:hypothetical protein
VWELYLLSPEAPLWSVAGPLYLFTFVSLLPFLIGLDVHLLLTKLVSSRDKTLKINYIIDECNKEQRYRNGFFQLVDKTSEL